MRKHALFGFAALMSLAAVPASAGPILPSYSIFSDGMAKTTIQDGTVGISLALSADLFYLDPVTNDGAGTYTASPGFVTSPTLGFGLDWLVTPSVTVDGAALSDYSFKFYYDLDSAAGTDQSNHGIVDVSSWGSGSQYQESWNLFSDTLSLGVPGIIQPPSSFFLDPSAIGQEYTFLVEAARLDGTPLGNVAIAVDVNPESTPVPEPATLTLLGMGALGLAFKSRSKRNSV